MKIKYEFFKTINLPRSVFVVPNKCTFHSWFYRWPSNKMVTKSRVVIYSLCLIGCCYQLSSTVASYFKYQQTSVTKFNLPGTLDPPSATICTPFINVLDYNNDGPAIENLLKLPKFQRSESAANLLTTADIFNLTPAAEYLIASCVIRLKDTLTMELNQQDCHQRFYLFKYLFRNQVCYTIAPRLDKLSLISYTNSISSPDLIYSFDINQTIAAKMTDVQIIVHDATIPLFSSKIAKSYNQDHHGNKFNSSMFESTFTSSITKILGFPYDARLCSDERLPKFCFPRCVANLTVERFGKLLPNFPIGYGNGYKFMAESEYRNYGSNMDNILNSMSNTCDRKCVWNCEDTYTLTEVTIKMDTKMSVKIVTPSAPFINGYAFPVVKLLDLVVYVFSALGSWFGFVIVSTVSDSVDTITKLFLNCLEESHQDEEIIIVNKGPAIGSKSPKYQKPRIRQWTRSKGNQRH